MLDKKLIDHCAPTLATLKTANLFTYPYTSDKALETVLSDWNRTLNPKGVSLHTLRIHKARALIYVCRSKKLEKDFQNPDLQEFLMALGYLEFTPEYCIEKLRARFACTVDFPHEIGLFLGYPVEDVKAYIENAGQNFLCSGDWKVYYNEGETIKLFQKYRKCRAVYAKLFESRMKSVYQLTVAG